MALNRFELRACEEVDACVFSGDLTERAAARGAFKVYVARWTRAIQLAEERDVLESSGQKEPK